MQYRQFNITVHNTIYTDPLAYMRGSLRCGERETEGREKGKGMDGKEEDEEEKGINRGVSAISNFLGPGL